MLFEFLKVPSDMANPATTLVSAKGVRLQFEDGSSAIDLSSGLWNVNFGYGNSTVAEEIEKVLHDTHYATLFRYSSPIAQEVADELAKRVGWNNAGVLFSTSGSAMNDMAIKLAVHWNHLQRRAQRNIIVSVEGSYHGMTLQSMNLSGDELAQNLYCDSRRRYIHLPHDRADMWEQFFSQHGERVLAVVIEPILGTGIFTVTEPVLKEIACARDRYEFPVIADEVATGFYRTCTLTYSEKWSFVPDVIGFSKGLTNGTVASSALVFNERIRKPFIDNNALFVHGETQAGSPVAVAATKGVLRFIDEIDAHRVATELSQTVGNDLYKIAKELHLDVRGTGLFWYIGSPEWKIESIELVSILRQQGVLVHPSLQGVQIIPQVTMTVDEWKEAHGLLRQGLCEFKDKNV